MIVCDFPNSRLKRRVIASLQGNYFEREEENKETKSAVKE